MWTVDDDALLAGFATGDPDAADVFVARFQRQVFGVALAITGDSRAADDVSQEAFMRAWRSASSFDGRRGSVATWLKAITRNAAIDTMRSRRNDRYVDPATLAAIAPAASNPDPADEAVRREDVEWLTRALRELPEDQRRAVLLAGVFGLTAQDVADHDGIPLGTAKFRIRLAMDKLRRALEAMQRTA